MSESPCFGIHLGNSSICLVLNRDGKSEVLANDLGNRVTPAVLAFNDNEWEIGESAKLGQTRNKPVISNNKLILNNESSEIGSGGDCRILDEQGNTSSYEIQASDKVITLTPDDVATKLLSNICNVGKRAIRNQHGDEVSCVLAAPLHWSEATRRRLETAAELAGFNVLQVISEPSAAVLGLSSCPKDCSVLVYRLGGTTCDVTVLSTDNDLHSVKHQYYNNKLGGNMLTTLLADYIAQEFYNKWKLDPRENKRAMNKLLHHAEDCKRVLSTLGSCNVHIESLVEGVDWNQTITRARFDNLISSKLNDYLEPLQNLGEDTTIQSIVLCGGGVKVPKLQNIITSLFPRAQLLNGFAPDELVALGCAKQAKLLHSFPESTINKSSQEIDCIKESIYVKCDHEETRICVFPSGTPTCYETTLPVELPSQDAIKVLGISVYQGDLQMGKYEFSVGDLKSHSSCNLHAMLLNNSLKINVI